MKKELYDRFECEAGGCSFTCCSGWEISLDSRECEARTGKADYIIGCNERCPFERMDGLCSIVIDCGDAALPDTCRTFPRLINEYDNYEEYSLSFGCPHVFDLVCKNVIMAGCGNRSDFDEKELYIRENIIRIIKEDNRPDYALMAAWLYLTGNEETVYSDYMDIDLKKAVIYEINSLFQDIVVNYLNVVKYDKELGDIWDFSLENDIWEYIDEWNIFKQSFEKWDDLIKNCLAEKIFFSCVNEDVQDMVQELQIIIAEYIVTRYSCFLKNLMGDEMDYQAVRKYFVVYSRILGHNSDSVKEFFESTFGKKTWEPDYAAMLLG